MPFTFTFTITIVLIVQVIAKNYFTTNMNFYFSYMHNYFLTISDMQYRNLMS